MIKNRSKGFTLIELLVVIAIIGILSAVVLASLNTARSKAKDASVQTSLDSMRAEAEIYYGSNSNSYQGVCANTQANNGIATLGGASASNNALGSITYTPDPIAGPDTNAVGAYNAATCHDTSVAWAAEAPLLGSVSATPKMWCVDSTGASKQTAAFLAAGAVAC